MENEMTKAYRMLLKQRKELEQEYLADTGAKSLVRGELMDWLRERPDHPLHGLFFGDEA